MHECTNNFPVYRVLGNLHSPSPNFLRTFRLTPSNYCVILGGRRLHPWWILRQRTGAEPSASLVIKRGWQGARSAGLEPAIFSVLSHSSSQTGMYSGGQRETNERFCRKLALLEGQGGTGKDTRLRSDCGQNLRLSRRVLEPEGAEGLPEGIFSAAR